MRIQVRFSAIKGIKLHEWLLRFAFGGAICVLAGLISKKFGPAIGGLFLAFPAIFPAGASLVESHEKQHKARAGIDGANRAHIVAGIDAAGASLGCIGLAAFAVVCWLCLPRMSAPAVFALATFAWAGVSFAMWLLRKSRLLRSHQKGGPAHQVFRHP